DSGGCRWRWRWRCRTNGRRRLWRCDLRAPIRLSSPGRRPAARTDASQYFFERQCVIQQGEPDEQQLDQQLLLPALPEARLEIAQNVEHAKYIARCQPL